MRLDHREGVPTSRSAVATPAVGCDGRVTNMGDATTPTRISSPDVSIRAIPFVDMVSDAPGAAEPSKEHAMSVTASTITTTTVPRRSSLRRTTVVAGLAAAAVTTVVAAAVHAGGVSFDVDGEMIPLAGFAQMTFLGAVLGGLLLAVLDRRCTAARRRFLQATAVLTVSSCVPSVVLPDDVATKVALVALHVLAAAMIVSALARHAHD